MILTTSVGSYPIPDWLAVLPSEQAREDATRVVFDIQRRARIGRGDCDRFAQLAQMRFRRKPAAAVVGPLAKAG